MVQNRMVCLIVSISLNIRQVYDGDGEVADALYELTAPPTVRSP